MLTMHEWMFSLIDAFALVTSSLSRFARLWRVHRVTTSPCDDFTVTSSLLWRVHRVTSSLCNEFTCNQNQLRHIRSAAYSVEPVLNKHQTSGDGAYVDCYRIIYLPFSIRMFEIRIPRSWNRLRRLTNGSRHNTAQRIYNYIYIWKISAY